MTKNPNIFPIFRQKFNTKKYEKQLAILSLSALTLFSCGGTRTQAQSVEEINQTISGLIQYIPDHRIDESIKPHYTEEFFTLLQKAWNVPSPEDGIGDEEFLYFFIEGNGDCYASINGTTSTDNITAYQIFKLIDPKKASIKLDSGTDTTAKDRFSYSFTSEDGDGVDGETVNCLSHNDGGLLVVYQHWYYGDLDGYNTDDLKIFRYQDGKLSERNDLLPKASISDFAAIDTVSLYNAPDDDYIYTEYDTEDAPKMLLYHKWMYNDPVRLFYKWDGAKFIPAESDHQTKQFNILSPAGIGRIFLGDNPPESLDGFQKNALGKTVYFNRDGKKQFKLSLNDEGKIDTITILSDRYTYRMDVDGPTNEHYGIGYRNVGFGLFEGQYFVMKDGVWVRTIDGSNDSNPIDMFGETSQHPVDYPHTGVIEFYTTGKAVKNIYPEIGKKVDEFDDNPEYDENATVTLIKIYRQQPAKIAEEVFRKLFPEIKEVSCNNDTPLKCYGSNPEEDEGCESGKLLACYPLKNGGYIVTVAHDFSGPGCASEYQFYTKKYIDGKISNSADLFPTPQLDDLLNPAKTAGHESDIAEFRKMYDKSPIDYLCYDFQPPKTLSVRLHPWDCEDAYHNMDKVMLDPYNGDKIPEYTWDGEKFVKE